MNWFAHILVHHPFIIILAVLVFSSTCVVIPFTLKTVQFPNFKDPQMGFTTRGTVIASRLVTWTNLEKSTKPSGQFTNNPKEFLLIKNNGLLKPKQKKDGRRRKTKPVIYSTKIIVTEENNNASLERDERYKALQNLRPNQVQHSDPNAFHPDKFFCDKPDEKYSHVVIKSVEDEDLFSLDALMAMCRLENQFINNKYYKDLCMENDKYNLCCKPWSLPNYIAILHSRTSCLSITEEDVQSTFHLLTSCAQYFHNLKLNDNCYEWRHCGVPAKCIKHNAVYNILNFLTPTTFLPPNNTAKGIKLSETMIFLPLACSTAMLPYYHELVKSKLEYDGLKVVAMNFGIKSALFDEFLLRDTWWMGSGALFVFACMWLYTQSLFLTLMTIIAIVFSLAISYFMYVLVFEIKFFPFMNILATIVAIGIGSDDAFIFCKIWHIQKFEKSSSIGKLMTDTFKHAFFSMFVTSLTTSAAFLASFVSSVTAISCFSIFAGTAVIANYVLMITWFPACVVLWDRYLCSNIPFVKSCMMVCWQRWCCFRFIRPQWNLSTKWPNCFIFTKFWKAKETFLLESVIKLRYIWLIILFMLGVSSAVIVLYYPRLQLPNSSEFQLFASSHPFEQYDFNYKNNFWFKRERKASDSETSNFKLPLRFVWGILPYDNGDQLNPQDFGTLTIDETFDVAHPESQMWLLNFCENLKTQPFFEPMMGPLLPNCFIETFMESMQRKCKDDFTNEDRSPCCETATFPFRKSVFEECIIDEIADIYATPAQFMIPGMAGPKFSKDQYPTIKSVIVEFYSNYSYSLSYEHMNEFYNQVETWMQNELKSAPKGMKNGWFISELDFYDLQRELSKSTQTAILLSMGLALVVLLLSTLNILTSIYAIITITCSIFVVMAVLILLGWKLNILESVAVSTAIGLTVDFSLHYTVNYKMCPDTVAQDRIAATKHALTYMAGPALMAAITTGAAGAFMLPSLILPYIQIGIFLVLVMTVSWIYATFFLGSLLAAFGPQNRFGQFSYKLLCCPFRRLKTSSSERNQPVSSSMSDAHELESLTYKLGTRPIPKPPLQRSSSCIGVKFNTGKYTFTDQSPSATSAITIIMADDN